MQFCIILGEAPGMMSQHSSVQGAGGVEMWWQEQVGGVCPGGKYGGWPGVSKDSLSEGGDAVCSGGIQGGWSFTGEGLRGCVGHESYGCIWGLGSLLMGKCVCRGVVGVEGHPACYVSDFGSDPYPLPTYSSGLQTAFMMLLLISSTWLLALLSVNSDSILFHYLFAGFNCLQVQQIGAKECGLGGFPPVEGG